jgi:hypothetical protein
MCLAASKRILGLIGRGAEAITATAVAAFSQPLRFDAPEEIRTPSQHRKLTHIANPLDAALMYHRCEIACRHLSAWLYANRVCGKGGCGGPSQD